MSAARLELVVGSGGVMAADKALKQLTATAKETEKQQQRMAAVVAEVAAAEEKAAQKAIAAAEKKAAADARAAQRATEAAEKAAKRAADIAERKAAQVAAAEEKAAQRASAAAAKQAEAAEKAARREAEAWNEAKQRAIAAAERKAEAAEKAARRQTAAAEKAAKREDELWNNAIQRAKAGLDGVLPIRPSLVRIESELANRRAAAVPSGASGALAGVGQGAMSAMGMGALAGGVAGVTAMAATKLVESLQQVKAAVIDNIVEDDKLIARLGGLTNSAEEASDVYSDLKSRTLGKLPSTVKEVTEAFLYLGNTGLDNGKSALKAYSNVAAQTGASLGEVTRAVQMATLGNFRSLREYGINVKAVGNDLQVTFRGQTETIGNSADAIESYMQRLGTVQFAGAVERQMDSLGGAVKKADDAWEKFVDGVADSHIGDAIKASVGASTSVLDAMTASVDALFGKTQQFNREAASLKSKQDAEAELDRTMRGWADPTASKSEIAQLAAQITAGSQSSADKALAVYARNSALIDKLKSLGETRVGDLTLEQAQSELDRQYRRDNGGEGKKTRKARETLASFEYRMARDENAAIRQGLEWTDRDTADEEAWMASAIEKEAKRSALEVQRQENAKKLAIERGQKQLALQHRLANIGIGPQSQSQQVHNRAAGAYYELGNALQENLSGKNGEDAKLAAEQTYADKSVAIEKERAREIAEVNRELVASSLQNAEAMFGGLTAALKNAGGEQNAAYQGMFALQQSFGLATAEAAMLIDMAKASEAGFPANVPLYLKAAADGAQLIAKLSSLSYSGAYDAGGDVPARSRGLGGERGVEIVGPAGVIGRAETAALLGGGNRNMRIIFTTEEDRGFHGSTRDERVFVHWVKRNGPLIRSLVGG